MKLICHFRMSHSIAVVINFLSKSKIGRFISSYFNKQPGRIGNCTPDVCETLDGRRGSACCRLGYRCPMLADGGDCGVYNIRPRNCRVFPANEEDLKLVRNCGYRFK